MPAGKSAAAPFEWGEATPESQGLSSEELDAMRDGLEKNGTKTLLIVRNDKIVYEWYAEGFDKDKPHFTASMSKALVGGLSLGLAMDDGLIRPEDLACEYVPQWKSDPLKSKITVAHLATHFSGIEDSEQGSVPHMELPGWKGAFWRQEPDPFTPSRDDAPVMFEPGSQYAYSNPGMAMLAYCVTAALRGRPQSDIRSLLAERIFRPIGAPDDSWSIGYKKTFEVDGLPLVPNWGGGSMTPRTVALLGRLMLRKGDWDGQRILSEKTVRALSTPYYPKKKNLEAGRAQAADPEAAPARPEMGLCFWVNSNGCLGDLPLDAFGGAGAHAQLLCVVPSLNLIVVRNGGDLGQSIWDGSSRLLYQPIMDALLPPAEASPVFATIEWAPPETVVRKAPGSDTWPCTWGDDSAIYTSWADGWGFEPLLPEKRSMGFAKIEGGPEDFLGVNIRSESGERIGDGAKGEKCSGMLMVDGVLYGWTRNANRAGEQCRLIWSKDRGQTWSWADWQFEQFGYCTFINYGPNYAGARDGYVYATSHDNPSAYTAADRMILMRVPKGRILERGAYEFFVRTDKDGQPVWSPNPEARGAVFENFQRCRRQSVSYHAPSGRYLWWQQNPNHPENPDSRFRGGFAVYDAPEPWGPWTTVFHCNSWDMGPGETACFPTKWMSEDGKTLYLVFSGDDAFSLRKGTLIRR